MAALIGQKLHTETPQLTVEELATRARQQTAEQTTNQTGLPVGWTPHRDTRNATSVSSSVHNEGERRTGFNGQNHLSYSALKTKNQNDLLISQRHS